MSESIGVYVAYGPDGIITGAALAAPGAQKWLTQEAAGRTVELVLAAEPIHLGMRRSEIRQQVIKEQPEIKQAVVNTDLVQVAVSILAAWDSDAYAPLRSRASVSMFAAVETLRAAVQAIHLATAEMCGATRCPCYEAGRGVERDA